MFLNLWVGLKKEVVSEGVRRWRVAVAVAGDGGGDGGVHMYPALEI